MFTLRTPAVPLVLVAVALLLLHSSHAFYLPGVAPTIFKDDQEVTSYVSSVISPESTLQFDYYTVPFCRPSEVTDLAESLGEALVGDKAQTSSYKFQVLALVCTLSITARILYPPSRMTSQVNRNLHCSVLCRKKYSSADVGRLADFALLDYRANMCATPFAFSMLNCNTLRQAS